MNKQPKMPVSILNFLLNMIGDSVYFLGGILLTLVLGTYTGTPPIGEL